MEAWLEQELTLRRQTRRLAALARETGIAPQRLQRLARGDAAPETDELEVLVRVLRPTAPASRPAEAAKAAAAAAARPAAVIPGPVVTGDLARLRLPEQGGAPDFLHRQRLIEFARQIRDWPQKHHGLRPGDMARLQSLWNEAQTAISAINVRIWGSPAGPGTPVGMGTEKKRKTHHSLRFLFKQAAEEKLPRETIDELSRIARDAVAQGVAKGFLDAFVKAARAVLDEDDFKILLDKAVLTAGPEARPETLLEDPEEEDSDEAEQTETPPEA
jgi:hypothetical protein